MRRAVTIELTSDIRDRLQAYARGRSTPVRLAQRSQIVLLAAAGKTNEQIAKELHLSRPTIQLWRDRFATQGIRGIEKDAPRPGRKPKLSAIKMARIIKATLETTPANATQWSVRSMAKAQGVSRMAVQRIWSEKNLKPHLVETFKLSRDPRFVEKLVDVVGLSPTPRQGPGAMCG